MSLDIRKLKAELAGPLEFGETESLMDGEGASDMEKKSLVKVLKTLILKKKKKYWESELVNNFRYQCLEIKLFSLLSEMLSLVLYT